MFSLLHRSCLLNVKYAYPNTTGMGRSQEAGKGSFKKGQNVLRSEVRRMADRKGKGDFMDAGTEQGREGKVQEGQRRGYYMGTNMDFVSLFLW